jgi:Xaa-Pro aminopeptidase
MPRDAERLDRFQAAMKETGLDAVVCSLPEDVLLATSYFPVVGTSLAVVTRDREVVLFAPRDEMGLADCDTADQVIPYEPSSLAKITSTVEALREPVRQVFRERGFENAVLGYECGECSEPASYAAMHLFGNSILELFQGAALRPAGAVLARLKAVLTAVEIDRVRRACRIAGAAFEDGARALAAGLKETEAAENFRAPILTVGVGFEGVSRSEGYVNCMSGANSAKAHGAFARSRAKEIEVADLVLTHCNSHADGYWTDITRTYCVGPENQRQSAMYAAVFEARAAAFDAIRPAAKTADVDRAAREVMQARGFGDAFKHATGHGVGFAAIDHNARPRLHPASDERLESGMVCNVEPAVYLEGFGGVRHCDMVAVTESGAELLTPFQCTPEDLIRDETSH